MTIKRRHEAIYTFNIIVKIYLRHIVLIGAARAAIGKKQNSGN